MPYPGGKHGPGVYQRLINDIPPHDVYIAACAGHDALALEKLPAKRNILIDLDPEPLDWWAKYFRNQAGHDGDWELVNYNCILWMEVYFGLCSTPVPSVDSASRTWSLDLSSGAPVAGNGGEYSVVGRMLEKSQCRHRHTFLYVDPPYLMTTRTSGRIYNCEMTEPDHVKLLETLRRVPCMVMLSGYRSDLYCDILSDWRTFTFESTVRSGEKRTEWCWCNYPEPTVLHDSRFVGNNKRQRENVRRRTKRLVANLLALPDHQRQCVLDGLNRSIRDRGSREQPD